MSSSLRFGTQKQEAMDKPKKLFLFEKHDETGKESSRNKAANDFKKKAKTPMDTNITTDYDKISSDVQINLNFVKYVSFWLLF